MGLNLWVDFDPHKLESWKNLGQLLAWFSAFLYFGYKAVAGWFIGSASLRLTCTRTPVPVDSESDYLSIVAVLKRGPGSTLHLHQGKARVTYADGKAFPDLRPLAESPNIPAAADTETGLISFDRL